MIVYLATYPRSGNSLIQQVVITHFRYLPMQFTPGILVHDNWRKYWEFTPDADMLFGTYRQKVRVRFWHRRRLLRAWISGPESRLTPDLRRSMASERNVYFIKHHNLPPDEVFPGEVALQAVRHPGAVFRSYLTLLQGQGKSATMRSVVEGRALFGSWSDYHRAWDNSPMPNVRLAYEDMAADNEIIAKAIRKITRLPYSNKGAVSLEKIRQNNNPHKGRHASSSGWQEAFAPDELLLLRERHSEYAATLGYDLGYAVVPSTTI